MYNHTVGDVIIQERPVKNRLHATIFYLKRFNGEKWVFLSRTIDIADYIINWKHVYFQPQQNRVYWRKKMAEDQELTEVDKARIEIQRKLKQLGAPERFIVDIIELFKENASTAFDNNVAKDPEFLLEYSALIKEMQAHKVTDDQIVEVTGLLKVYTTAINEKKN
jgi:hypothetical protein